MLESGGRADARIGIDIPTFLLSVEGLWYLEIGVRSITPRSAAMGYGAVVDLKPSCPVDRTQFLPQFLPQFEAKGRGHQLRLTLASVRELGALRRFSGSAQLMDLSYSASKVYLSQRSVCFVYLVVLYVVFSCVRIFRCAVC